MTPVAPLLTLLIATAQIREGAPCDENYTLLDSVRCEMVENQVCYVAPGETYELYWTGSATLQPGPAWGSVKSDIPVDFRVYAADTQIPTASGEGGLLFEFRTERAGEVLLVVQNLSETSTAALCVVVVACEGGPE